MKLANAALIVLMATGFSAAAAAPCFNAGTYVGKGFGEDKAGKVSGYDVTAVISDSNQAANSYKWESGSASFSMTAKNGDLLIDGKEIGGTIQCGNAALNLAFTTEGASIKEEWVFVGRYLLRQGTKTLPSGTITYQELLFKR